MSIIEVAWRNYGNTIQLYVNAMSDDEFNRMESKAVTTEEKATIEKYGWVFARPWVEGKDFESRKYYSCGGKPFRISVIKPTSTI